MAPQHAGIPGLLASSLCMLSALQVVPNPTDKGVEAGLELLHKKGCDCIVSFGGGSSHDNAKAIGIVASNGGTIHDYEGETC